MNAIRFNSTTFRIAGVAVVIASYLFAGTVVVWTVANTSASAADQKEVADLLVALSPADPQTHRASAILHETAYEPGDLEIALTEYEKAAAASPNNFLFWQLLGSARTRAGEFEKAEAALRRAKSLAPNYSRVQWALGNLLLRQGRSDEGYAEIRNAISGDPALSASAVTLAMQLTGGDLRTVNEQFKGFPSAEVSLAIYLIDQKRFAEAREVWQTSAVQAETDRTREAVKSLAQKAIESKQFRLAAAVTASITAPEPPAIGKISNPGFESAVRVNNAGVFEWRVPQTNFPQHAITDARKRSGAFSLLAVVNAAETKNFHGIAQTVAVESGGDYRLSISYLSDLNSRAEYFWEVISAVDSKQIAISNALIRSDEWKTLTVEFAVPADIDGIEIRLVRGPCAGAACTSSGNLWFDDLELNLK